MNGDRFKKRLPKFLGKISDFEDLLIAEDKEFDRVDKDIDRFDKGLFINTLNDMEDPDEYLKRVEKDYGLSSIGSYKERINAVLVKKRAKEPTTPYMIEELGDYYSNVDNIVKFISQYEEYSFIVELLRSEGETDVKAFVNALEEIKPAHLDYILSLLMSERITYALYAVIDREKTMYQRLQSEFEKEHKYYQGMANILLEKEITYKFPEVYFLKDDGINVKEAKLLNGGILTWGE